MAQGGEELEAQNGGGDAESLHHPLEVKSDRNMEDMQDGCREEQTLTCGAFTGLPAFSSRLLALSSARDIGSWNCNTGLSLHTVIGEKSNSREQQNSKEFCEHGDR